MPAGVPPTAPPRPTPRRTRCAALAAPHAVHRGRLEGPRVHARCHLAGQRGE